jgi:hypothetical protein
MQVAQRLNGAVLERFAGGILLQGAGVIISVIMLHSEGFSKVTAYAGLIGNGLDLIQHVLYPFAPQFLGSFSKGWACSTWSGFRCWRVTFPPE